jgi:hypothetical protein
MIKIIYCVNGKTTDKGFIWLVFLLKIRPNVMKTGKKKAEAKS